MRTIITGSRTVNDNRELNKALDDCGWIPTVVLCGEDSGADSLGIKWAENNVPIERFPTDRNSYGKCAEMKRNFRMADNAGALIALWDGSSRGTFNMIKLARIKNSWYTFI